MSIEKNKNKEEDEQLRITLEALSEQKILFEELFNSSPDAITLLGADGKFVDCNDKALEFFGIKTKNEFLQYTPDKLSPEFQDDGTPSSEAALQNIHKAFENGRSTFEWLHKKLDSGELYYCNVVLAPFQYKDSNLIYAIVRDISETKELQEQVFKERNKYQELLKLSPNPIFVMNTNDGSLIESSQQVRNYLGYDKDEIKALTILDWDKDIKSADEYRNVISAVGYDPIQFERIHTRKDGSTYIASIVAVRVMLDEDEVLYCSVTDITKEREVEQQLIEQQERFELTVSGSGDGLWEYNSQTDENWFSPLFKEMLGYTDEELPNVLESWSNNVHPDDINRALKAFTQHLEKDVLYDITYRMKRKDGEYIWLRARAKSKRDENGKALRTSGSVTDITELVKAKEEIQEKQQQFTSMVSNVPGVIYRCLLDEHWTMLYISDEIETLSGYPISDFINNKVRTFADIMHPGDIERVAKEVQAKIDNKEQYTVDYRVIRKDGEIRWVRGQGKAIQGERGDTAWLDGAIFDITELEKAKAEVVEKQQQFTSMVSNVPGVIYRCLLDEHWTMLYISDEIENLSGYPISDFINNSMRTFTDIIHPDDVEHVSKIINEKIKNNEEYVVNYRVINKDGTLRWVRDQGKAVHLHDGDVGWLDGAIFDITVLEENKQALKKSKKEAENANKAKSFFLANMSHELRTPLNAILGFSQMMAKERQASESQKEKLKVINRSGSHLLAMINDILDLSKIEAGKIELENKAFNIQTLIDDISAMFLSRANDKNIRFIVETDELQHNFIYSDEGKIRQILINIIGNAMKFTNEGGISLRVKSQTLPDKQHCSLTFEVEDSGPGIEESMQKQIFDPFKQANTVSMQKGTGLGLSICKSFTELMDGEIHLESELGKGSCFIVSIPVEISEEIDERKYEENKQVLSLADNEKTYTLLVVDDDETNRLLLRNLLEGVGFKVVLANDGKEALKSFEQNQPDFIWMDMRMPVMDGYEATSCIRELPNGKEIPIVAITASAFKEQREKILASGCNDLVHKPYKEESIFAILKQYLGVEYTYLETKPAEELNLSSVSFEKLPDDVKEKLKELFIIGDVSDIYSYTDSIEDKYPEEVGTIVYFVKKHDLNSLIKMLT